MSGQVILTISVDDPELTAVDLEATVLELKHEIEQVSNFAIPVNETQQHNRGTLGPEWLPVLTAILAAPVLQEAVKGLVTIMIDWMKRRKIKTITIQGPKGKHKITATNMTDDELKTIQKLL